MSNLWYSNSTQRGTCCQRSSRCQTQHHHLNILWTNIDLTEPLHLRRQYQPVTFKTFRLLVISSSFIALSSLFLSFCGWIFLSPVCRLSFCLSLWLSVYFCVVLSVSLPSVRLCFCLSICLTVYRSAFLSVCPSVFEPFDLFVCLSICLPVYRSAFLLVCLSFCISVYMTVCLSISVRLSL